MQTRRGATFLLAYQEPRPCLFTCLADHPKIAQWSGLSADAGVQMAEAPPEALLPEWDVDEEEAAEVRLGPLCSGSPYTPRCCGGCS